MAKTPAVVSFTTIITLLLLVFTEATHAVLITYIAEVYILISAAALAFLLFILLHHTGMVKRKYLQVGRLTIVLLIALSVEAFANYVIGEIGKWLSMAIILVVIYVLAWYGYVETHKLKAL
jgi:hypothetical protein